MQVAIWYKDECAVRAVEIMRFRDFVERETARNVDLAALCELYSQVFLSAYPDRGDLLDSALLTFSSEVFAPQLCPSNPPGYSDLFYPVSAEDADPMQHDTMECVLVNDAVMCERIWVCGARDGGRTGFVGIAISEGHLDASRYVALAAVVCRSDVVDELRFDEGYMLRHFCRELSVFETERDDLCELACSFWAQVPGSLQAQAVAFPVFFDWFSGAFLQGVERSLLPSLFALLPRFLTRDGVSVMLDTWRKFFACFWRGSEGQAFVVGEWLFLADEFGGFVSANESEKAFSSSTERQCLVRYSESLGDYGCLVFSWSLPREKSPKIFHMRIKYYIPGTEREVVMMVTEAKSPKAVPVEKFNGAADKRRGFYYIVSSLRHKSRCCRKCWNTLGELIDEVKQSFGGYFVPSSGSAPYCE